MADEPKKDPRKKDQDSNKASGPPNPWLKRLLFTGGILVLLGAEVAVSYVLNKNVVLPKYLAHKAEAQAQVDTLSQPEPQDRDALNSNIYMLDNLVINPMGTNGLRYIAMSIGLGVDNPSVVDVLKERDIQIRDAMNSLLANKSMSDFVDMSQRDELKHEIMQTVNAKINPSKVESIYFTEFVIQ